MKPLLRFEVFKRDAFTCRYCGRKSPEAILEVDHVIPRAEGGPDDLDNLVTSCAQCNIGKGARLLTVIPDELNLHEKAAAIAEHERQLQEYRYWRGQQREREDQEVQALAEGFSLWFTRYWEPATIRRFLRLLGYWDVAETLEWVIGLNRDSSGPRHLWLMFCKACWNKVNRTNQQNLDPRGPDTSVSDR